MNIKTVNLLLEERKRLKTKLEEMENILLEQVEEQKVIPFQGKPIN
jgi:hypothetical protein